MEKLTLQRALEKKLSPFAAAVKSTKLKTTKRRGTASKHGRQREHLVRHGLWVDFNVYQLNKTSSCLSYSTVFLLSKEQAELL